MQIVIFKPLFSFIDLHRKSLIGSKQIQFYTQIIIYQNLKKQ